MMVNIIERLKPKVYVLSDNYLRNGDVVLGNKVTDDDILMYYSDGKHGYVYTFEEEFNEMP